MFTPVRDRRVAVLALAATLVATGGIAYASIPDAGGVVHTCYTKSSGAWRVIDADAGQACKSNELPLTLYATSGADALFLRKADADAQFLRKTEKAADSDMLDGRDSTDFLGATATAADSNRLGGLASDKYVAGIAGRLLSDYGTFADGATATFGLEADDIYPYPGLTARLTCDPDSAMTLAVTSETSFAWWWDDTFGETPAGTSAEFPIGPGVERHRLRAVMTQFGITTILDLDSSTGGEICRLGWTVLKSAHETPGP